jgi:sugar lactone lactonase YvrE
MRPTGFIAVCCAASSLLSCGESAAPFPTGSLSVTINAPAGITPSVMVSGAGGYHETLTATQTLSGLAVGSYTVSAASVRKANPIVATVYRATVTGGAATVSAGATATASATYAAQPGSGALWVSNLGGFSVVAYTAAQLEASTGAAPATALATGGAPAGVALDTSGNLWVGSLGSTVVEFTASQLGASGSPTPAVTLTETGPFEDEPISLAFDAGGSLWLANAGNNTVVAFTASQLGASGSPTPAVTLSTTGTGSLNGPESLAFDASGNLWVGNGGNPTVV